MAIRRANRKRRPMASVPRWPVSRAQSRRFCAETSATRDGRRLLRNPHIAGGSGRATAPGRSPARWAYSTRLARRPRLLQAQLPRPIQSVAQDEPGPSRGRSSSPGCSSAVIASRAATAMSAIRGAHVSVELHGGRRASIPRQCSVSCSSLAVRSRSSANRLPWRARSRRSTSGCIDRRRPAVGVAQDASAGRTRTLGPAMLAATSTWPRFTHAASCPQGQLRPASPISSVTRVCRPKLETIAIRLLKVTRRRAHRKRRLSASQARRAARASSIRSSFGETAVGGIADQDVPEPIAQARLRRQTGRSDQFARDQPSKGILVEVATRGCRGVDGAESTRS